MRTAWEAARQHLAFIAYHETDAGVIFIDRIHTCMGARRRGVATSLLRQVVNGKRSELQVRKGNTGARRVYEKEGYVVMGEGEGGEYEPQRGYQYMKKPRGRVEREQGNDHIQLIKCGASTEVPKTVWMWMEEQIRDEDHLTRKQVQMILRPDDENMRYEVAILKDDEKHDAMGRSRRVTRIINYNETRAYTTSSTDVEEISYDR